MQSQQWKLSKHEPYDKHVDREIFIQARPILQTKLPKLCCVQLKQMLMALVLRTLSGLEIKRAFGYGPEMLHVVQEVFETT